MMEMREFERTKIYPYLPLENLVQLGELSRTLIHDGHIIACTGLVPMWEGVCEVWQIPSVYVAKYKIAYVKAFRALIARYAEKYRIRRMQTHSPADDLHDTWMRCMGFECEGTLKAYNRFGEDYRIWRREFIWA
jgi:hypothetical protein